MTETRRVQILDGHPVPYSLTVQIDGCSVAASSHLSDVDAFLAQSKPGAHRTRIEGAYVWYEYAPQPSPVALDGEAISCGCIRRVGRPPCPAHDACPTHVYPPDRRVCNGSCKPLPSPVVAGHDVREIRR